MIRLTERDRRILRDLTLSHVLSRDQMIALGYFGSVTRANARLKALRDMRFVRAIDTPFFGQSLYRVLPRAAEAVGERLARLAATRVGSPRFLQHALSVTNVRISLTGGDAARWRFEQQLRTAFRWADRQWEVRPDGLIAKAGEFVAVEADLGHVASAKFREKLRSYDAFVASGACARSWGPGELGLLVVTTSARRAARLRRLLPDRAGFSLECEAHDRMGIPFPGAWS